LKRKSAEEIKSIPEKRKISVGVAVPTAGVVAVGRLPISAGTSPTVKVKETVLPSEVKLT